MYVTRSTPTGRHARNTQALRVNKMVPLVTIDVLALCGSNNAHKIEINKASISTYQRTQRVQPNSPTPTTKETYTYHIFQIQVFE